MDFLAMFRAVLFGWVLGRAPAVVVVVHFVKPSTCRLSCGIPCRSTALLGTLIPNYTRNPSCTACFSNDDLTDVNVCLLLETGTAVFSAFPTTPVESPVRLTARPAAMELSSPPTAQHCFAGKPPGPLC